MGEIITQLLVLMRRESDVSNVVQPHQILNHYQDLYCMSSTGCNNRADIWNNGNQLLCDQSRVALLPANQHIDY